MLLVTNNVDSANARTHWTLPSKRAGLGVGLGDCHSCTRKIPLNLLTVSLSTVILSI